VLSIVNNSPDYWEFIRSLRNDKQARENSMNHHIITFDEHANYMKKFQDRYYVCIENNKPIGYVGRNPQGYISIAVLSEARGKGIAKYMLQYLRQKLKENNLQAIVSLTNERSIRLFETCGFVKKYYIFEGEKDD